MENTIRSDERLVADLRYYRAHQPTPGDLVIFYREHTFFVKRVIAVGNDVVQGKNSEIFVNGARLHESYVKHTGNPPPELNEFGPVTVTQGKFFALGDNRDVSYDSREPEFGLVDTNEIRGKALYLVRPLSREGVTLR
jgi:signal peptidase I